MRRQLALAIVLFAVALPPIPTITAGDKASAIESLLSAYTDAGAFNGAALVAEQGKVIVKKGYGLADFEWKIPNSPDTKFRLGSITKQFTATLVMQLVEEGKLSIDARLADVLPYYRKDTGGRITIHHLLTHTSGIPSYTGMPNFRNDISRDPYGVREFVEKFCSGDLEFEPGARFRYNNSGYFILGAVIEQLTGQSYRDVLKARVFGRLGMAASGYDLSQPLLEKRARGYEAGVGGVRNADYLDMSLPYAAGSLYSTVEDLYLWDQALYADTILPAKARDRMFTPGLENYGYGWTIRKERIGPGRAERMTVAHGGGINGFNTLIVRMPETRQLVVLLNNTGGTNLRAMFEGIVDILYDRVPAPPKRGVARLLYDTIGKSGVAAALAEYRQIAKNRPAELDLSEGQLNRLGYELLRETRTADAIEIFKLNVETFAASANAYDSLAEAYMEAGMKDLAVKNYAKALELDPTNRNAVEKLNVLMKR